MITIAGGVKGALKVETRHMPGCPFGNQAAEAMLGYLEGILLLAKWLNNPNLLRRLGPALAYISLR